MKYLWNNTFPEETNQGNQVTTPNIKYVNMFFEVLAADFLFNDYDPISNAGKLFPKVQTTRVVLFSRMLILPSFCTATHLLTRVMIPLGTSWRNCWSNPHQLRTTTSLTFLSQPPLALSCEFTPRTM